MEGHITTIDKRGQMEFNRLESFPCGEVNPMNCEISCELYARMTAIPMLVAPDDDRKYFKSVYIERENNELFAVVTNGKLVAIERIGASEGPDDRTAIAVDPVLIAQSRKEISFGSSLVIVANPALNYTTIKTTFGYQYPANAMVQLPAKNYFNTWREWAPDEIPTASAGAMYWNAASIAALATASPTGCICFPEFIDTNKPVVLRDIQSADWFGMFMPIPGNEGETAEPATVPEWV